MAAKTAVHSNAFNFLSFVQSGVDPRTGQYTVSLALPELKTNDLSGPIVPLSLSFNPLNTHNSGFGRGWELRLSQYDAERQILSLASGETFLVTSRDGKRLLMEEQKLTSFFFYEDEAGLFRVVHKSGSIEMLRLDGSLALPETVYSAEGHRVDLTYLPFGSGERRLHTVSDAAGPLLEVNLTARGVELLFKPDGAPEGPLARFELILENNGAGDEVSALILPTAEQAAWRFGYATAGELRCITTVQTPLGALETIVYAGVGHGFPGNAHEALPRVSTHRIDPGFAQPVMEVRYRYDNDDLPGSSNNFLGNNSSINWDNGGRDNLYQVNERYLYGTTQSHYSGGLEVRKIERTFNRFHLLTDEKTTQGNTVHRVTTTYYAEDDKPFSSQVAQCQLARRVDTRWSLKDAPGQSRLETVSTAYDIHGNLTEQVLANKVKENYSYFPVGGIAGECPADPAGFVRTLREKTVTPAPDHQPGAPVLRTRNRYALMPPVTGTVDSKSDAWLVLSDETLYQVTGTDEQALQHSAYTTFNDPHDPLLHGRRQRQAVTLNGQTTTTDYAYQKLNSTFVGETVLQTTETLTGFDHGVDGKHTQKTVTLEHSLLHGQPLLTRDDNDVQIRYTYDALQRVTSETVAPDTPYTASRTYRYVLSNAPGQQASQEATDVKGVQTCTLFDGLNRVIKEQRQDKDNMTGARAEEFRDTYFATYNELGDLAEEIERDWCSADSADDLVLLSQYRYDDWGQQQSVTGPDLVTVWEVNDPIKLTQRSWQQSPDQQISGRITTTLNLFGKPIKTERFDASGEERLSLHEYFYDGQGQCVKEIDVQARTTLYRYDVWARLLNSTLPNQTNITRQYASHSAAELPVALRVIAADEQQPPVLAGSQEFDGLHRLTRLTVGPRIENYEYQGSQLQVSRRTTPDGKTLQYSYLPGLTERPTLIQTPEGGLARFDYDRKTARLDSSENDQGHHEFEYDTAGSLKKHRWTVGTGTPWTTLYRHSLSGRQLVRTDVSDIESQYTYGKTTGQLQEVSQGNLSASFEYDTSGRLLRTTCKDKVADTTLITDMEYDDQGREVQRTLRLSGQPSRTLSQTWQSDDRLLTRHLQTEGGRSLLQESFSYDLRGRLELYGCSGDELPKDRHGNEITEQLFSFDELDNIRLCRTTFKDGSVDMAEFTYAENDPCQLESVSHSHSSYTLKSAQFSYDRNGHMLNDEQGQRMRYDSQGRLIDVSNPHTRAVTQYRYDGHNHLFAVTRPGQAETLRFYQNDRLSSTVQDGTHIQYLYDGDQPLGQQQAGDVGQTLLLMTDAKHSVIGESQQTDLRTAVYNPYGERSSDSQLQNQLAFNGEVLDEAGGWYLLGRGYRAYNPCLMRFHSPDSMSPFGAGGINPYVYCAGDPVNFRDPTGHFISSGDEGRDLMIWGAVDVLFGVISGNPLAIIAGVTTIVAGAGVSSPTATDSEKQFSSRVGMVAGIVGMLYMPRGPKKIQNFKNGPGVTKITNITNTTTVENVTYINKHKTTNIVARRNSSVEIMDGSPLSSRKNSTIESGNASRRNSTSSIEASSASRRSSEGLNANESVHSDSGSLASNTSTQEPVTQINLSNGSNAVTDAGLVSRTTTRIDDASNFELLKFNARVRGTDINATLNTPQTKQLARRLKFFD
jgi:RHS repeat-associated protein